MRRAVVVINPLSGQGHRTHQIRAHAALATETLARHGIAATVRPTTQGGDAGRFAREAVASGDELLVVWGGDGTINEVAAALAHSRVELAIIPAGSGNGLAGDLGLPFEPRAALEVAGSGRSRAIDAGEIDGHLFFNIAGIGVDALIAARFAERGARQRGLRGYLHLSTNELLRYRPLTYRLVIDGDSYEQRALLIALANGRQYGNRMHIAPGARLDDGLLEVVTIERLSLLSIAWRLPSVFRGTLRPGRGVTMRAAKTVRIAADTDIPFHVDGEPRLGGREVAVRVHPAALRVRVLDAAVRA